MRYIGIMATRITIRFDFDETRRLGPGKIALLEAIGRHGYAWLQAAISACLTGGLGCW